MGNLGLGGVSSLRALNEWISVINTNITNANRVGFKETRVSISSGEVDTIGKTLDRLGSSIQIPSAQLRVDKTLILDYEQGLLNPTQTITEFGINGKGYFVVEDYNGERYATRDGSFHFDNDGYLVSNQGLRVLSKGQDYIRVPTNDEFYVDGSGTTLGSRTYGDRQLMMVNLPNAGKLFYSKYGFTTFELGNLIPLKFENTFKNTIDGLNPYLIDEDNQNNFVHNKALGLVSIVDNGPADNIDSANALLTSHRFTDFRNSFRFVPATIGSAGAGTGFANIGFSFGQQEVTDTVADSGYGTSVYQDNTGAFYLGIYDNDSFLSRNALPALNSATEYELSLIVSESMVTLSLTDVTNGGNLIFEQTVDVPPSFYRNKYQSIGTGDRTTLNTILTAGGFANLATTAANDTINLTKIGVKQINSQPYYDTVILGGSADELDSVVQQFHLEESTAVLSDQLPMLGNNQKLFSAMAKIINVHNTLSDDLHNLIR